MCVVLIIIVFSLIINSYLVAVYSPVLCSPIKECVAGVMVIMVHWEQIPLAMQARIPHWDTFHSLIPWKLSACPRVELDTM